MTKQTISDVNILPRFLVTLNNAYFQDDNFSQFTGIIPKEGELYRASASHRGEYVYLPIVTMLLLVEILGSILTDSKGIKNNMKAFIDEFMPNYSQHLAILYNLRNSLVHDWDGGLKVILDATGNSGEHMQMSNDTFIINVGNLFQDLRKGFNTLREKADNDSAFNGELTGRLKKKINQADSKIGNDNEEIATIEK